MTSNLFYATSRKTWRVIYVIVIITEALPYAQPCVKLLIFLWLKGMNIYFSPVVCNLHISDTTNMCTTMIKEIASYYNSRHTDVFLCTLGASKAFDRVHLGKSFALLHNKGLPPVANRLLTDMYTRQRMCTTWNGVISEFFSTENGVKQGGIFIPYPFVCVHWWIVESPPLFGYRMPYG